MLLTYAQGQKDGEMEESELGRRSAEARLELGTGNTKSQVPSAQPFKGPLICEE